MVNPDNPLDTGAGLTRSIWPRSLGQRRNPQCHKQNRPTPSPARFSPASNCSPVRVHNVAITDDVSENLGLPTYPDWPDISRYREYIRDNGIPA